MLTDILKLAFASGIQVLRGEIEAYPDEADLWKTGGGIRNSAGNLALHQAGALRYLVGSVLGGIAYERDREGEFGRTGVPRAELLAEIDAASDAVRRTLDGLSEEELDREYPVDVGAGSITTATFLVHLATHTSWHNGQVNYHRRLLATA